MKRLYVLRHAKSSWDDPELSDFERPLNSRGLRTAPFMGELMRKRDLLPEAIISSPAARARHTAELVNEAGNFQLDITLDEGVYEASPGRLVRVTANSDEAVGSLLLVGHNPGIEGFIHALTGRAERMATAALAVIDLDIEKWTDLQPGSGSLVTVIRPRDEMDSAKADLTVA